VGGIIFPTRFGGRRLPRLPSRHPPRTQPRPWLQAWTACPSGSPPRVSPAAGTGTGTNRRGDVQKQKQLGVEGVFLTGRRTNQGGCVRGTRFPTPPSYGEWSAIKAPSEQGSLRYVLGAQAAIRQQKAQPMRRVPPGFACLFERHARKKQSKADAQNKLHTSSRPSHPQAPALCGLRKRLYLLSAQYVGCTCAWSFLSRPIAFGDDATTSPYMSSTLVVTPVSCSVCRGFARCLRKVAGNKGGDYRKPWGI